MPWLLVLLFGTQLTSWWNPTTWGNAIGHIASGAIRDIENWARNAINWAMSLLDEAASLTMDVVTGSINDLYNIGRSAYSWASSALDWIAHAADTVGGWINNATNWLWSGVVAPALDDLRNWAQDAWNGLTSVFNSLSGWVTSLWNNYIAPAFDWVSHAEQWLQGRLASWWDELYAAVFAGPIGDLEWLWDNVPTWVEWLGREAYPVVHALFDLGDGLLRFLEDPIGYSERVAEDVEHGLTSSWSSAMLTGQQSRAAGWEQELKQVLGL